MHFCGDKLSGISVFQELEPCCSNPNCCHNTPLTFKVDTEYIVEISPNFNFKTYDFDSFEFNIDFQFKPVLTFQNEFFYSNIPPPLIEANKYIEYQSFLI